MARKVIRFVGNAAPYFTGDVAGFDPALADRYIAAGVAVDASQAPEIAPLAGVMPLSAEAAALSPRKGK